MKYEVIDNFLDEDYFNDLEIFFTNENLSVEPDSLLPWFFQPDIAHAKKHEKSEKDNTFYMTHQFYDRNVPMSPFYEKFIPLLNILKVKCLLRIKANLYPNTKKILEHAMHVDYDFRHSGAVLSINTCDGYTKLKDGTKIDSIRNRILLFDPSEEHCSTTTTNVPARFNININYIDERLLCLDSF